MIGLVYVSLAIIVAYLAAMVCLYGMQEVISEYAYLYGTWAFTGCLGSAAALLMPAMIDAAPEEWKVLGFLAPCALLFVAAAPCYKGADRKIHRWAASLAGAAVVLWGIATAWHVPVCLGAVFAVLWVTGCGRLWMAAELMGLAVPYAILIGRNILA